MEDCTWDFLLFPFFRKTKQIGVSFEFVSPAIIQLFLSWKKKPQKKHGAWGNTEKFGELEKRKTHSRLTYATGRNHSLDGLETESLGGEVVVGFLHMVTGFLLRGRVFGMEVYLCWFGLGIAHCFWGTWLGVFVVGSFGVFTGFGGVGVGRLWLFSSLEDMAWLSKAKQTWEVSSGILSIFCILDIFWREFGKRGWEGIR
jgi:hypothetical protein